MSDSHLNARELVAFTHQKHVDITALSKSGGKAQEVVHVLGNSDTASVEEHGLSVETQLCAEARRRREQQDRQGPIVKDFDRLSRVPGKFREV